MVEIDDFTYHVKLSNNDFTNRVDYSLITQERTQKLDLLMHLITNLTQALVVCGPQGIGKTTLLKALEEQKLASWDYYCVQGSLSLTLEKLQEQLSTETKSQYDHRTKVFGQFEHHHKKKVLVIDDAGRLEPGLISEIIKYAASHSVLRVVFVLTPDDLYLKNRSDSAIDECCFIEIPPLSEKQCGDFLRYLSAKPWSRISLNGINDSTIKNIYQETHGIPGRIIAEFPSLSGVKKNKNSLFMLIFAVAGLVAIALTVQWYSAQTHSIKSETPVAVNQQMDMAQQLPVSSSLSSEVKRNIEPVQISENLLNQYFPDYMSKKRLASRDDVTVENRDAKRQVSGEEVKTRPPVVAEVQNKPLEPEPVASDAQEAVRPPPEQQASKPVENSSGSAVVTSDNSAWFKAQPNQNYTLQVMVLSKEQAIRDFQKKYQFLGQDLRYLKVVVQGKEKYILYYGSFANSALAYKTKQSLPPEFRHSLVKRISAIKNK